MLTIFAMREHGGGGRAPVPGRPGLLLTRWRRCASSRPSSILMLIASALMLLPALHAAQLGELADRPDVSLPRALLRASSAIILGLATANRRPRNAAALSPDDAASRLRGAAADARGAARRSSCPGSGSAAAYFEMLSSLTTTGRDAVRPPRLLPEPLHLWRALVGWCGGLMILVAAFADPRAAESRRVRGRRARGDGPHGRARGGTVGRDDRRASLRIAAQHRAGLRAASPALLALLLIVAGDRPFVALCHAMADALDQRHLAGRRARGRALGAAGRDCDRGLPAARRCRSALPDVRSRGGAGAALRRSADPADADLGARRSRVLLFLRSFVGASEIDRQDNIVAALRAIWGSLFTVLSFLTTTGFESRDWRTMQLWSDLPAPGIDPARRGGDGRRHRHHRRRRQAAAALCALSPRAARDGRADPSERRLGRAGRATA